jgi:hypothetical protein
LVKLLPELSTAMVAWALTPLGPANFPVGSTPGFQPVIVPSSAANKNTAGADTGFPVLSLPVILKAPAASAGLNTVPSGVPPVALTGVGMFTASGFTETGVLLAPGT